MSVGRTGDIAKSLVHKVQDSPLTVPACVPANVSTKHSRRMGQSKKRRWPIHCADGMLVCLDSGRVRESESYERLSAA